MNMNTTLTDIEKYKRYVLQEEKLTALLPKLKGYKYIDELQDMRVGTYVRWIHSKRRKLTNGAFLVRVDLRDDGIHMLLRNGYNQMFSLWADECMLFQKITAEERVMLMAKARL